MKIRLNKYLADCGVAARRKADELIAAGTVRVNGRVARLGQVVDSDAEITVQGKRVHAPTKEHQTIVLNKPAGVVTTMRDERGRPSVAQFAPPGRRLFPVGRLDAQSTGVLLLTSDGELSRILTHPSFGVEKEYEVIARGDLNPKSAAALGASRTRKLADGSYSFRMTLREGKNRQVRRMCAQQGLRVVSLRRTRLGPVNLGDLKPGKTRPLAPAEVEAIKGFRAGKSRS